MSGSARIRKLAAEAFTTSEVLTKPVTVGDRTLPLYLNEPEIIFKRIWANPVEDKFLNLAD